MSKVSVTKHTHYGLTGEIAHESWLLHDKTILVGHIIWSKDMDRYRCFVPDDTGSENTTWKSIGSALTLEAAKRALVAF